MSYPFPPDEFNAYVTEYTLVKRAQQARKERIAAIRDELREYGRGLVVYSFSVAAFGVGALAGGGTFGPRGVVIGLAVFAVLIALLGAGIAIKLRELRRIP